MATNVPNWKQVSPANKRKVSPLVRHYMGKAHPFTACVRDNSKRFGPERAKRICAVVKDLGKRTTRWRPGGKVSEAPLDADAYVEAVFDSEWAPVLEAEGVTVEELADWSDMAVRAGVLEAVEFEDPAVVVEAAQKVGLSHARRQQGEGIVKAGDSSEEARGARERLNGNLSEERIRAFQRRHGLQVDGKIGRQTATALLGDSDRAKRIKVGRLSDDQRARLRRAGRRTQQSALAEVMFKPSELVDASGSVRGG
jgi:putative peptidoglycan binding protein